MFWRAIRTLLFPMIDESDLLLDVHDKSTSAFEELYERHHRLVYGVSELMLGDGTSAEDNVQSVFLSVWIAPHAFRGGSFTAWLICVTKNRARDMLRARKAHRETVFPGELAQAFRFESEVHTHLEVSRVYSAIAELPHHQRALIELGILGDRTHGEMAELTGLPLGTVKTRIRAGLKNLRLALAV
jgi:RNA polymerase sigma-70 factor (ECF subfamily)